MISREMLYDNGKFLCLIDGDEFIEMWQEYYDKTQEFESSSA